MRGVQLLRLTVVALLNHLLLSLRRFGLLSRSEYLDSTGIIVIHGLQSGSLTGKTV